MEMPNQCQIILLTVTVNVAYYYASEWVGAASQDIGGPKPGNGMPSDKNAEYGAGRRYPTEAEESLAGRTLERSEG
jgi:hypothetical protein